jgi:hypothetical protein
VTAATSTLNAMHIGSPTSSELPAAPVSYVFVETAVTVIACASDSSTAHR